MADSTTHLGTLTPRTALLLIQQFVNDVDEAEHDVDPSCAEAYKAIMVIDHALQVAADLERQRPPAFKLSPTKVIRATDAP